MATEKKPDGLARQENANLERSTRKETLIITANDLDTPYPYCLLPQTRLRGRGLSVEALRWQEVPRDGRTLLSVSTWDGRDILSVKSGD